MPTLRQTPKPHQSHQYRLQQQPQAARFAIADLSDDDKKQVLARALEGVEGEYSYCWIRDVFADYFTYEDWDDDATYKRTYTIGDDWTVELGDKEEVIGRTVYEPIPVKMGAFSLPTSNVLNNDKFNVYPNSLLFEIRGQSQTFADKGVTITSRDLADIVNGFTGATIGLEHTDTVLGDKCGHVTDLRLVSGRQLFGTVAIPKGLDELIPPGPRKVSVEIYEDAAGKMSIPKVDLVLNPRIEKAALMAVTKFAKFAGKRHSDSDMADLQAIHDLAAKQGAACGAGQMSRTVRPPQPSGKGKFKMTFREFLAKFSDDEDEEEIEDPAPRSARTKSGMRSADQKELDDLRKFRNDQLTTKRAAVKAQAVAAFGQGTPALASAEKAIETASDEMLTALSETYSHIKPTGGNGGRTTQATSFSGGGAQDAVSPSGPLAVFDAALGKKTAELADRNKNRGGR